MNDLPPGTISRDDLALRYLDSLPYVPYPVQEEALLAWFETDHGVMVCAPTGTGKTLIAEAAAFEALHTGQTIYYTTPLIALTDQKFIELQNSAERWGFRRDQVGLVTGNRRVNPQANVLVVVAEILLNRLLTSHWAAHEEATAEKERQALAEQPDDMRYWEKLDAGWWKPHESGKTMVCGHTAQRSGRPLVLDRAVCIDTWAYGDGWLTCLDVEMELYFQANERGETRLGNLRFRAR